ncbi:MAG: hypothetical protein Q8O32_01285 [bacterium]|nr:hypothetical protein [bacterium]
MDFEIPSEEKFPEQEQKNQNEPEPERGVETIESILEKIEMDFFNLQNETAGMSTAEEGYEIIRKLENLYDKTLDLSNEIGYQPMTGRNKFATPTSLSNEKKIKPLRDRIHNFLMDDAWEKYEKLK